MSIDAPQIKAVLDKKTFHDLFRYSRLFQNNLKIYNFYVEPSFLLRS